MFKQKKQTLFTGREKELDLLEREFAKKTASLAVITGRRRIGKSRLIEKFAENKNFLVFSGLAPSEGIDDKEQKMEFARVLGQHMGLSNINSDDWSDLFQLLAQATAKTKIVILFDEVSWMAHKDELFLAKLKNAWDLYLNKNPNLMLVLCGSVSSWIEKNILNSTGFFGRISLKITLGELSIKQASSLLDVRGIKASSIEKLIYFSLTGGIPWYIELISPKVSLQENFRQLCFSSEGILVTEFNRIFNDFFGARNKIYSKIVENLAKRSMEQNQLAKAVKYSNSGVLSEYINELVESGFIAKDYKWSFKTFKFERIAKLRLRDNYLRFYFKFILPNILKIRKGQMEEQNLFSLPSWNTVIALQFENLVLNNRDLILKKLRINSNDLIVDNPYFQSSGKTQSGCQIDYLIQTRYKVLYLCEIKFQQGEIKSSIVNEITEKIDKLKVPRGFSVCPVLIHSGCEIPELIIEKDFFYAVIDFTEFL